MENTNGLLERFSQALIDHDKETAIKRISEALVNRSIDVRSLYENILAPSLNQISSNQIEQEMPIWEEHLSSSIVRSVLELTYPYVIAERDANNTPEAAMIPREKAIVFCLEEEYHELGARMITDFLTLLNFDTYFIRCLKNKKRSEGFLARHFKRRTRRTQPDDKYSALLSHVHFLFWSRCTSRGGQCR